MRKFCISLICFLPLLAVADISGVYKVGGGKTMTLHYRDSDHLRMNLGPGEFMLVREGKAYMVNGQDGQWMAVDMSSMGKMMQQMGAMAGQAGGGAEPADRDYRFRKTGGTETVAGYQGQVYEAVGADGERTEVVVSDDEDIRTLTRGWLEFSGKMISRMGAGNMGNLDSLLERDELKKLGGTLRVGDSMRLQSVSTEDKPDAFFRLPPGTQVQDMSNMRMPGR